MNILHIILGALAFGFALAWHCAYCEYMRLFRDYSHMLRRYAGLREMLAEWEKEAKGKR